MDDAFSHSILQEPIHVRKSPRFASTRHKSKLPAGRTRSPSPDESGLGDDDDFAVQDVDEISENLFPPKIPKKRTRPKSTNPSLPVPQKDGYRCCPHLIPEIVQSLDDRQKQFVRDIGFEPLLHMEVCCLPKSLTLWLVNQVDHVAGTLELAGRSIPIKPNVHRVLGLPAGPIRVPLPTSGRNTSKATKKVDSITQAKFSEQGRGKPLRVAIQELKREQEKVSFCKSFLLIVLAAYIAPTSNQLLNRNYLDIMHDLSKIPLMNWCDFAAEYLFQGILQYRANMATHRQVPGCVHILPILYADIVLARNMEIPQGFPRIQYINSLLLDNISSLDLKATAKGHTEYGSLNLKDIPIDHYPFGTQRTVQSNVKDSFKFVSDQRGPHHPTSSPTHSSQSDKLTCYPPVLQKLQSELSVSREQIIKQAIQTHDLNCQQNASCTENNARPTSSVNNRNTATASLRSYAHHSRTTPSPPHIAESGTHSNYASVNVIGQPTPNIPQDHVEAPRLPSPPFQHQITPCDVTHFSAPVLSHGAASKHISRTTFVVQDAKACEVVHSHSDDTLDDVLKIATAAANIATESSPPQVFQVSNSPNQQINRTDEDAVPYSKHTSPPGAPEQLGHDSDRCTTPTPLLHGNHTSPPEPNSLPHDTSHVSRPTGHIIPPSVLNLNSNVPSSGPEEAILPSTRQIHDIVPASGDHRQPQSPAGSVCHTQGFTVPPIELSETPSIPTEAQLLQPIYSSNLLKVQNTLLKHELPKIEQIYLPVCHDSHWILVVINLTMKTTEIYDTAKVVNKNQHPDKPVIDIIVTNLQNAYNLCFKSTNTVFQEFKVHYPQTHIQCGLHDCGFSVIKLLQCHNAKDLIGFGKINFAMAEGTCPQAAVPSKERLQPQ